MAVTQPVDEAKSADREPFLHIVARDFQWVLRAACILLVIATVIFMMVFWVAAIGTVILLLLCYALLIITDSIEERTDVHDEGGGAGAASGSAATARAAADPDQTRKEHRTGAIERRLTRISIEIVAVAVVLAITLAAVSFGWKVVPIAGIVLIGYIILVTAPVWGAWMNDTVEEEVVKHRKH